MRWLLVSLWNYGRKWEMEKQCLETLKYARPHTWCPPVCSGLRLIKGEALITDGGNESVAVHWQGSPIEWMVHGGLACGDPGGSHCIFLMWMKVGIHVKQVCFHFCYNFAWKKKGIYVCTILKYSTNSALLQSLCGL